MVGSEMAAHALVPRGTEEFTVNPSLADGVLTVRLRGTGDAVAVVPLQACLAEASEVVRALALEAMVFDVRELYFLTAGAIRALAAFVCGQSGQRPHIIEFVINPRLSWQRRCFSNLAVSAPLLVIIRDG